MPTLASLRDHLGPELLTIALAPRGVEVEIEGAVVHDPGEPLVAGRGDLILAVGLDAGAAGASQLVEAAAGCGAAGVVLKRRGPLDERVTDVAAEAGVALLTTPAEIGWGQLFTLVRTAAAAGGGASTPAQIFETTIGDLFGLADAVASAAGGAVTIEDPTSRVLAFSNLGASTDAAREATILGRRVPDALQRRLVEAGVGERLRRSDEVVSVDLGEGAAPRRAIGVRPGGALIASIWIAEGERPLSDATDAVLEEAARIAALHLLRHQMSDDLQRRVRGELLHGLLAGEAHPDAVARELGLPRDAPVAVIAVATLEAGDDEPNALLTGERIVNLLGVYFQSFRRRALVAAVDKHVYALVADERGGSRERLVSLTRDAIENAMTALDLRLRAGIGPLVTSMEEIPASRAQADQALLIGARDRPQATVIDIEEVRGAALLLDVAAALGDRPRPRSRELALLEEHDRARGSEYVETLRTYLDVLGNPVLAAERLDLHPNTVRHRMRRIAALTGVDMADPERRFPLELELRLRRQAP